MGEALEADRTISIGLGRVNGRRFAFSAGIGFDAEAVRRIDLRGRDRDGRRASNAIFAATVVRIVLEQRLRLPPQLTVEGYGRAACIFVANGRPYTYAGPLPVTISEEADFGGGLDFAAPREITPASRSHPTLPRNPRQPRDRPSCALRSRHRRLRGALRSPAPAPDGWRGPGRCDRSELQRGTGRARRPGLGEERRCFCRRAVSGRTRAGSRRSGPSLAPSNGRCRCPPRPGSPPPTGSGPRTSGFGPPGLEPRS